MELVGMAFGAITLGGLADRIGRRLVASVLPESIQFLCKQRRPDSLERINNTLSRMGHEEIQELPPLPAVEQKLNYRALFSDRFRSFTLLLCIGYFFHIMTFYYILKWIPEIVVDMGYEP